LIGRIGVLIWGFVSLWLIPTAVFAATVDLSHQDVAPDAGSVDSLILDLPEYGSDDDASFGATLVGLRLLGPGEEPLQDPPTGLSIGAVFDAPTRLIERALRPLWGRPLSMQVVADAQVAVAGAYRRTGFALMSVTAPPQEVTKGVLQLEVVEFHLGAVATSATGELSSEWLSQRLRVRRGDRIDVLALSEDLSWLNRNPYRRTQARFSPGAALGATDLQLDVTHSRPWQLFAGWSNWGSPEAGTGRAFFGFGAAEPRLSDALFSYQWTTNRRPRVGAEEQRPSYTSHSGAVTFSPRPRQSFGIEAGHVSIKSVPTGLLASDTETTALSTAYRSAISNFLPGRYLGDIILGADMKRIKRATFFDRVLIGSGEAEVFHVHLGWAHSLRLLGGRTEIEVQVSANPGGVLRSNENSVWNLFTDGRVTDI